MSTFIFSLHYSSPTLKTAMMTSRTNLKQQLMREQIRQLDHKEKLQLAACNQQTNKQHQNSYAIDVPVSTVGVEVPPQILQVRVGQGMFLSLDQNMF